MGTPAYTEWNDSQRPALELLVKLGWEHISPGRALHERGNVRSRVLLEGILESALRRINRIEYGGKEHLFSDANIRRGIEGLRDPMDEGVIRTNEHIYDLLTLGKSLKQNIEGDEKSYTLRYIDWENIGNNTFHVTEEFEVAGLQKDRRPDLVLFVNGIPLGVIECKRRDKNRSLEQCVSQMLRNQHREEGIPKLFFYSQLLVALHPNALRYGTAGTDARHWMTWEEQEDVEGILSPLLRGEDIPGGSGGSRLPTGQDKGLWSLCSPERLMELCHRFVLFDAGEKKIARYRQYFDVKNTVGRLLQGDGREQRPGGVLWGSQGSGKSLTMVMLAKNLLLHPEIESPRIVLITDQVELDKQIWNTFKACGTAPVRATTGAHLMELLEDSGNQIIATVVHKFDAGLKRRNLRETDRNIFVLVDESHRSQYGLLHARMKKVLPNACYIGFTGTPLTKKEKSTAQKFGGLISIYPMEKAVEDGVVVPLRYQGRDPIAAINEKQIDRGFDRIAEPLSDYQAGELKMRYAREEKLFKLEQVIEEIAADITRHYTRTWQGTGLKGQIAAPDKLTAIRYHRCFESEGKIRTAVVISPPDSREGHEDIYTDSKNEVKTFWQGMMEKYGKSEKRYVDSIIESFKREEGIELLIVVDKLLVGFDAPRNTVLYLTKSLRDHALLQAIARVNRLFPGKDYGYIIDYRGILGDLDAALTTYRALAGFDREDLVGLLSRAADTVDELPQRYSDVWDVFKGVRNREDLEELEQHLHDQKRRETFYERLSIFARTFQIALSTESFHKGPDAEIAGYREKLKFFQRLRNSVRERYAETIDYGAYEGRIKKLMDTHVRVEEVAQITREVNIFEHETFAEEVERVTGSEAASVASKADQIAHRTKRTLQEKMDQDPVLYAKFSTLLQQAIDDFHAKRISDLEYLNTAVTVKEQVESEAFSGIPSVLLNRPEARAIYNVLGEYLSSPEEPEDEEWEESLSNDGIAIHQMIERNRIVEWWEDPDIEKKIRNEVEDYLLEHHPGLSYDQIDLILDATINIARSRRG